MSLIQNYGFTKTLIHNNKQNINSEIEWNGDYDGNIANINLGISDNGHTEFVSMQLTNKDLHHILGVQPVQLPLEKRLIKDFLTNKSITLEGALTKNKSRKYKHKKNRKTKRR